METANYGKGWWPEQKQRRQYSANTWTERRYSQPCCAFTLPPTEKCGTLSCRPTNNRMRNFRSKEEESEFPQTTKPRNQSPASQRLNRGTPDSVRRGKYQQRTVLPPWGQKWTSRVPSWGTYRKRQTARRSNRRPARQVGSPHSPDIDNKPDDTAETHQGHCHVQFWVPKH
jgi:hypothetical protein